MASVENPAEERNVILNLHVNVFVYLWDNEYVRLLSNFNRKMLCNRIYNFDKADVILHLFQETTTFSLNEHWDEQSCITNIKWFCKQWSRRTCTNKTTLIWIVLQYIKLIILRNNAIRRCYYINVLESKINYLALYGHKNSGFA